MALEKSRVIKVLKEARKCIAKLTPFPVDDSDSILNRAINDAGDYADGIREMISKLLVELEADEN